MLPIDIEYFKQTQRDANRYRFLRDKSKWIDGSEHDGWDTLGYEDKESFDEIVDTQIQRYEDSLCEK
jgi:hypothetical protein